MQEKPGLGGSRSYRGVHTVSWRPPMEKEVMEHRTYGPFKMANPLVPGVGLGGGFLLHLKYTQ